MNVVEKFLLVSLLALMIVPASMALADRPDHVIINSQNWQDVYSGMVFSYLYGVPVNFLVSTRHATILLYSISTDEDNILVLSNSKKPFITGYEDILKSRGYDNPFEIRSNELNLRLAEELANDHPEINKYIIVDDAYGYNAIAVASYATRAGYYVLFSNADNINDIDDFLSKRSPDEVILYGQLDREVKQALAKYDPVIINKGNRFDNNIEIVKRYLAFDPTKQVILTNGEFIESSLISGDDPVLFIGRENVPEQVRNFIRNSDIEVGILIGNELVGTATFIRRQLGISVFVKFAQGARQPSGAIAKVEDLDRFPMPSYDLSMEISSVVYNRGTGALEVTYRNLKDMALYFKSTITLHDGTEIKITGDESPIFLDGSAYKTVVYQYTVDGDPLNLQANDLKGDIFTVFGESSGSLEYTLQKSFSIDIIDVLDDTKVNITDLYYDKSRGSFMVQVKNTGDVDAYVNVELVDLIVNGQPVTVGADKVIKLAKGKSAWVPVKIEMVDDDFNDNSKVRARAYYGERELALIKITESEFELRFGGGYGRYVTYVLVLIVLLLLFFLGTKKKCRHCGHKNPRGRKTCEKCGARL